MWRRWVIALTLLCTAGSAADSEVSHSAFQEWLAVDGARVAAFARFEAMLTQEHVAEVVPNDGLWLVDRLSPECVSAPFVVPPESEWSNIAPTLRFIRDHVVPAIGPVRVVSAYRDDAFNTCIGGARRSAHRSYQALDLVPVAPDFSRADLIERLCEVHAREGAAARIGLGIYSGVRFHIDARGYRGWGGDHRGTSFPCNS